MAKIVVIDDEPAMIEVIVTLCWEKGHQVFPFNAPSKALEQLDAIAPQVVITDIKMETMTGFDVLRHVRGNHPDTTGFLIKAVGSTASAGESAKHSCEFYYGVWFDGNGGGSDENGRDRLRAEAVQDRRAANA